ncbi:MAG: transketolase family protein, partial [Candidatus Aegiribacteria sp.]|nr:transketolase family protein [Candidatus Aegiribacteria sp.]
FGRNPVPQIYPVDSSVEIGKGHLLEDGSDITLVACGAMVSLALTAREILSKQGISAGVIDMVSVKPLDRKLLIEQAEKTGAVVVAEDHQAIGGLFGAVTETLAPEHPVPVAIVAVGDSFGTSGTPAEVREEYKLTAVTIVSKAVKLLE